MVKDMSSWFKTGFNVDKVKVEDKPDTNRLKSGCKWCNGDMLMRKNRSSGSIFWGCAQYPQCTYTLPAERVGRKIAQRQYEKECLNDEREGLSTEERFAEFCQKMKIDFNGDLEIIDGVVFVEGTKRSKAELPRFKHLAVSNIAAQRIEPVHPEFMRIVESIAKRRPDPPACPHCMEKL